MSTRLICALATLAISHVSAISVRGVAPDRYSLYSGASFRCLSTDRELPAERVNDDTCDCSDGSDEPGVLHFLSNHQAGSLSWCMTAD